MLLFELCVLLCALFAAVLPLCAAFSAVCVPLTRDQSVVRSAFSMLSTSTVS